MNKKLIVFIGLVFVLLICSLLVFLFFNSDGDKAYIYIDNELYGVYDISGETLSEEFVVKSSYGYNTVKIENGKISVIDADCADKTCVKTGETNSSYKPIICMPHRLEIVITGGEIDGAVK